jgi:beta-phosphoglucomutase-like phosphatase (HAD superfamily)
MNVEAWMIPVDLVVFDHDGTLVNSLPVVVEASNEVMATFGFERKSRSEIVAGMVHPTASRLGLLAGTLDLAIQKDMARLYGELAMRYSKLAELYPGIEGLLRTYFNRPEARQATMPQTKWSMAKYVSSRISQRTRIRRNRFIQPCVRSTTQRLAFTPGLHSSSFFSSPRLRR